MRAVILSRAESKVRPRGWAEVWGGFVSFYVALTRSGGVMLPGAWRSPGGAWRNDVTFWEGGAKINREFAWDIAERLQMRRPNRGIDADMLPEGRAPEMTIALSRRRPQEAWLEMRHAGDMIQVRTRILPKDGGLGLIWPRGLKIQMGWTAHNDQSDMDVGVTEDITPDVRGAIMLAWAAARDPEAPAFADRNERLWRACETCAYREYNYDIGGAGGNVRAFGDVRCRWLCRIDGHAIDLAEARMATQLLDQRSRNRRYMDEWRTVAGERRDTVGRLMDQAAASSCCRLHCGRYETSLARASLTPQGDVELACGSPALERSATLTFQVIEE